MRLIMQIIAGQRRGQNWPAHCAGFIVTCAAAAACIVASPPDTRAQGGLVDAGEFSPANGAVSGQDQSKSSFFGGNPLSGQVSVIDHVKPGGMRLKRAKVPAGDSSSTASQGDGVANSHNLPLGGLADENAGKFQSLFPSLDKTQATPNLSGSAQQDKPAPVAAPKSHPIWQKSPFGGYYDASGNVRDVIKGKDLYRYGGTMADGMTPAPSGPVEQNSMGYIKWQPIHGGPPGWY